MTATAASFPNLQRNLKGFTQVLKYAACEWILIVLLFVDGALSYMLTSFANYCELQSPCILCTRPDHIFGKLKDGFYRNLFCRHHRSEISFLLSCNIHDKLVDGRGLCDECLSSHVRGHESDLECRRLIGGKLGYDGKFGSRSSVLDGVIRLCLCCNKPWAGRSDSHRLLQLKSHDMMVPKLNIHRDTELKITSEFKFCFPSFDDLNSNSVVRDVIENKPKKQPEPDANESRVVRCLAPESVNKEKLEDEKGNFNELPGLVSLDDCPSFDLTKDPRFSAAVLADLISMVETSNPDNSKDAIEPFSDNSNRSENISLIKNDEISKSISTGLDTDRLVDDTKNKGVNEDVKSLPAHNCTGEGNQISLNYLSPKLQDRATELLRTNSNSIEVRNLKNLFIEAISESPGLKTFDESSVIEGESEDRLENAREDINALSKELEEERNASSIAAYQAMAMITRLREEKASLRMEALQYLRMIEEQAEYDVEALEKANDLLTEKERELKDLEAELDYYRRKFPDETPDEPGPDASVDLDNEHVRMVNATCSKQVDMENSLETGFPEASLVDDEPVVITALSEIEDEKLYISHLLQKLEKKLSRLAQYGASRDFSDNEHSDDENHGFS
ncbi:LOW QUALITY PROTEIN: probable myosin-binding protein 4 [Hibiscus syriacus]|uniref:LOW QUALITY PROTEIN: probable myosin-binding protein 4 n=1 Tax=Hibiscus syriacus TaxID=106335 RepID=UPI0019243320|nr:LOW QUALITY PROTEIN: probable myosin-binding protein 4 [Hibiscus syriacus]